MKNNKTSNKNSCVGKIIQHTDIKREHRKPNSHWNYVKDKKRQWCCHNGLMEQQSSVENFKNSCLLQHFKECEHSTTWSFVGYS